MSSRDQVVWTLDPCLIPVLQSCRQAACTRRSVLNTSITDTCLCKVDIEAFCIPTNLGRTGLSKAPDFMLPADTSSFNNAPWLVHSAGAEERAESFADLASTNTQHNHTLFLHPSSLWHHFSCRLMPLLQWACYLLPQPERVNQSLLKVSKTVERLLKSEIMFIQNLFKCESLM